MRNGIKRAGNENKKKRRKIGKGEIAGKRKENKFGEMKDRRRENRMILGFNPSTQL
jgi:hypothetical protein